MSWNFLFFLCETTIGEDLEPKWACCTCWYVIPLWYLLLMPHKFEI
jgi:hypothetical protein